MKCRSENAAEAKFCNQCGAELGDTSSLSIASSGRTVIESAEPTIEGERKMVTALFADIVGSTELIANLDPEEARAIVDPALRIMIDAVLRYEGHVLHSTGDGICALFGAPRAYEDHPRRGVYAALDMQKELREHALLLATRGMPAIEVRVGINSGEVVARTLEAGDKEEYGAIGHTANLASRLQTVAPAGSIALSEHTRRLVEGYFELRPLGPMAVKGIRDPVDVYEVIRLGTLRSHFQVSMRRGLTKFVGRESELQRIGRALELAIGGLGQIVAVATEAGIGKSRLLFEFNRTLPRECKLLEAFSVSHGKATPWLPVIELLRGYFGIRDSDDAATRRTKIRASLMTIGAAQGDMLHLWALFGIIEGPDPLSTMDPQIRRQRTLDAIQQIILAESLKQPIVLIFEDLHWIDGQTQALLELLAQSIDSARILLLVTYRPDYRHNWHSKRHYVELRLDPLAAEDVRDLVSSVLPDAVELQPLKRLLIERTGGNPFFIEEMIQALFDDGTLIRNGSVKLTKPLSQLRVPSTVQGVLAERFDRLSATAKQLLQILAVIGWKLPMGLIREVALRSRVEVDPTLAELEAAEFIYMRSGLSQTDYIFKHALTQEVAYNSALITRRKVLHEYVGQALESMFYDKLDDHLSQLAHHYTRSTNVAKAIEYLGRAGHQAIQRSAHADAVSSLNAAIGLIKTLPDSSERIKRELPLWLDLGRALQTVSGYASSDVGEAYERALQLSERIGEASLLGRILLHQAMFRSVAADYKAALNIGQQLLALGETNREYLIEGHLMLGLVSLYLGDLLSSETHFVQGLDVECPAGCSETYQYAGDARAMCLSYLARTLWLLGYPDRALERSSEVLSLVNTLLPMTLVQAHCMHALLYHVRRELSPAEEWFDKTISYATTHGIPYWLTLCSILKGWLLDQRGDGGLGIRLFEEALCGYRATGAKLGLSWLLALRGELVAKDGRIDEGLLVMAEALSHIDDTGERYYEAEVHRLKGELLLRQSHPLAITAAEASFQQSLNIARSQHAKGWELRAATSLARLWLVQGRFTEGVKLLGPIYDWFVEGFDTPDLKDARQLLDSLAAATQ